MKIAVTTENGMIFQHFGKCQMFTVYTVENQSIVSQTLLDAHGSGHSALATLLKENQIDTLICGGIGQGAKDALAAHQINVICGVSGSVDVAIHQYLNGTLTGIPDFVCNHHHDHEENHSCHCHDNGQQGHCHH
jgi:predicted Fe-Mo cluster-binding NifX family protein